MLGHQYPYRLLHLEITREHLLISKHTSTHDHIRHQQQIVNGIAECQGWAPGDRGGGKGSNGVLLHDRDGYCESDKKYSCGHNEVPIQSKTARWKHNKGRVLDCHHLVGHHGRHLLLLASALESGHGGLHLVTFHHETVM